MTDSHSQPRKDEAFRVTVCEKCLTASCWNGIFMCDNARTAGVVVKTIAELRKLNLEDEDNWS